MTKKISFFAILFAFVMESMGAWASTGDSTPVDLDYIHPPIVNGNTKPSKAPAINIIPLTVLLDDDNLIVTTLFEGDYDYYIYDDCGEVVTSGSLNCVEDGNYYIDLGMCQSGTYTVVFVYEGRSFEGTFEIGE